MNPHRWCILAYMQRLTICDPSSTSMMHPRAYAAATDRWSVIHMHNASSHGYSMDASSHGRWSFRESRSIWHNIMGRNRTNRHVIRSSDVCRSVTRVTCVGLLQEWHVLVCYKSDVYRPVIRVTCVSVLQEWRGSACYKSDVCQSVTRVTCVSLLQEWRVSVCYNCDMYRLVTRVTCIGLLQEWHVSVCYKSDM